MAKKKLKADIPKGFPDTLRLMGQTWTVEYVKQVEKSEWLMGSCEGHLRRILIDIDLPPEAMKDTLVHECAHAVVNMMPGEYTEEVEEQFAIMFATGFLALTRDNDNFWEE